MRKAGRILGSALAVLTIGWCALWFAGRAAISGQLDGGLAAFSTEGVEIAVGGHEIGGFPFGYTATFRDVALANGQGARLELPELTGELHVTAPDTVTARFPARFDAMLSPGPGLSAHRVEVESEGLTLAARGLPGSRQTARLSARSVLLVSAEGGEGRNLAVDLVGLEAEAARPAAGEATPADATARLERLDVAVVLPVPGGGTVALEGALSDLRLTGGTDLLAEGALARMLSGHSRRPGRAEVTATAARGLLWITVAGAGSASDGSARLASGPLDLRLAVEGGDLLAEVGLTGADLGLDAPGRDIAGTVSTGPVAARYAMPLGPSEAFRPMEVALAVAGAKPDAAFWRSIDADGALPREAFDLDVAVRGTGRLTKPFAEVRPGEAQPIEPATLEIERARIAGLGARAEAEGDLSFAPGGQAPTGRVTVTLDGAIPLLRALFEAGLIAPATLQAAALGVANFTRIGDTPDELEAEIAFEDGAVSVNGQPLP